MAVSLYGQCQGDVGSSVIFDTGYHLHIILNMHSEMVSTSDPPGHLEITGGVSATLYQHLSASL